DAGALPEALQHDARPFEITDPVAVQIQDDFGALCQCPARFGGRAALFGERCRRLAIDAPEAVAVGERLQPDQRIVAPRRPGADEQRVDWPFVEPVLCEPIIGLPGKVIALRDRNTRYIETGLSVARSRADRGRETIEIESYA